jgi:hypothetical protein
LLSRVLILRLRKQEKQIESALHAETDVRSLFTAAEGSKFAGADHRKHQRGLNVTRGAVARATPHQTGSFGRVCAGAV